MKKLLKVGLWVGFAFFALIVLAVVSMGSTEKSLENEDPNTEQVEVSKAVETEKPKAKKEEPKEIVSQENYDKIVQGDSLTGKGGMTIDEVVAILGEADQTMETQSGDMLMEDYSWINSDFQTIAVNFTNGKVSFKMFMK